MNYPNPTHYDIMAQEFRLDRCRAPYHTGDFGRGKSYWQQMELQAVANMFDRQDADNATHYLFPMMFCGESIAAEVSALINDTVRSGLDGESWARY